ncbi:MAG: polymerase subunit sigma-70 [Rhodospirillales bacterium]|jgi:RNA polymerase sigma-70 factor (ECF subfamily)|nr:polymerase subunit sigma-70 [Rhodospirillales bacterium]
MAQDGDQAARATAERVARESYGKLIAYLAVRTRDVAAAEDALSEAFATAMVSWPVGGVPDNPEAWLLTVARRKMIDAVRRRKSADAGTDHLKLIADELEAAAMQHNDIPDERLALMFACAHPAIDPAMRAPLILQTVLGFDAAAIASAFLVSPTTMSQRLVRAKTKIKQAGIPFRVPERADLPERLDAVLEAIYAAFAEGWSDAAGTEIRGRSLAEEGIWLGRLVASLLPDEAETLGLLSLMLHADARRAARRGADGAYVPLAEQDTALWNDAMIDEAEALLLAASQFGAVGRYQLEAAIQSAHVVRRRTGEADWAAIESLYDVLAGLDDSPVIAINRAVAIAENRGAASGLLMLDAVAADPRLATYQPYWAARAELLARSGDAAAADAAYEIAIGLETDPASRRFLQRRRELLRN